MNWAVLEIMKTIIKNKRSYRTKIGRSGTGIDKQDINMHQPTSSGSQQTPGGVSGTTNGNDGASDEEQGLSSGDESGTSTGDVCNAEEDDTSTGSVGMKRKAIGSGGRGGKGKQKRA